MDEKKILDVTCAGKSIWFNKHHPSVIYCDQRSGEFNYNAGKRYGGIRALHIEPDVVCDFTDLPFEDNRFALVVFDPPHLARLTESSWVRVKYGCLDENWQNVIRKGFEECMRVLKPEGSLIFKWSETQFSTREVIDAIGREPLFGHRSGKKMGTHWLTFMKGIE